MKINQLVLVVICLLFYCPQLSSQQEDLTAYEISMDQDFLADFLHDNPLEAYNYTAGLRLGFYGELADHNYLGLPIIRRKVDGWLIDGLLDRFGYWDQEISHSFVLTINGFSPTFISDETPIFVDTLVGGYQLSQDIPFSSFTGFRSTRRVESTKTIAHSASEVDFAITSSFVFGFASLGIIKGVENMFGMGRPSANLWSRDEQEPYPTGQLNYTMIPLFMYSLSAERVLWRPMDRVLFQLRPEINLGYYTDVGIGLDFGKVMNSNRFIDNLSYTDTNNPGLVSISDADISFSLVAGGAIRAVFYNAHYHGMFGWNKGQEYGWGDTQKYLLEGYVGAKLQVIRKLEFNFSLNIRSSALKTDQAKYSSWGTLGFKYLMGDPGEGCYD